ncbi:MAG: hypothetical protein BWK80_29790 [Desulfobacteraceae bacterium IS3]|nr:MAG: hypothetical protein BWK80_29790 [Desulfobacteraceae bacterium IS3]
MTFFKYRFDFEVGNLIKSPCKHCILRNDFPHCIKGCDILDKIQTVLAEARSCSRVPDFSD